MTESQHVTGGRPAELTVDPPSKNGASTPPQSPGKAKRTLTPANILRTTANCAVAFPIIIRSIFRPKTSRQIREKVMLGVTAINDCRFCAWGHTHWATSQGVSLEEINQILSNQDGSLKADDPAEAAAILFGQHYAEHLDQVDPESEKNLRNFFSEAEAREIVGFVWFITFTNLSGNTVDALLERIRGRGRAITVFEGVVGAVLAPVLFVLVLLVKSGKLLGTDKRRAARHRSPQDVPQDSGSSRTGSKAELPKADLKGGGSGNR
jgi:AhpD family alkylhydroperoxidase